MNRNLRKQALEEYVNNAVMIKRLLETQAELEVQILGSGGTIPQESRIRKKGGWFKVKNPTKKGTRLSQTMDHLLKFSKFNRTVAMEGFPGGVSNHQFHVAINRLLEMGAIKRISKGNYQRTNKGSQEEAA